MYYNRNLITAEQHPTDGSEASGVFDLATQAYSQSKKIGQYLTTILILHLELTQIILSRY